VALKEHAGKPAGLQSDEDTDPKFRMLNASANAEARRL
jgi:hypothetical protein